MDVWVDWKTAIALVLPSVELIYCLEYVDFSFCEPVQADDVVDV